MSKRKRFLESAQAQAESYICAQCSYHGYGGWNCNQCGEHDLIRTDPPKKIFSEDLDQYVKGLLLHGA